MATAFVQLPEFLSEARLLGASVEAHWRALLFDAGFSEVAVQPVVDVSTLGDEDLWIDGRFLAIEPATLRILANHPEHRLLSAHGAFIAFGSRAESDLRIDGSGDACVTDLAELPAAEKVLQRRLLRSWGLQGVRFIDPERTHVEPSVRFLGAATVWPDVTLRGATTIGANAEIQAGCWVIDCMVEADALLKPYSVCEGATVGRGAVVGPMAHLRQGAILESDVKVGNFVEVKNTRLGPGAKASHLTYLGDANVGANANVGAGTITCNYDGFGKHRTEIGEGAFIGSNSALVAPVSIGAGAIVGAGSVITRDVPPDALAVERSDQRVLEGRAAAINERNRARAVARKTSE